MSLCLVQVTVATELETRDAWKLILDHYMKMMTFCTMTLCPTNGSLQMRPFFLMLSVQLCPIFLMLRLNEDDSVYCYCGRKLGLDWADMDVTFANNARFRDVMEDFGGEHGLTLFSDITPLVALAVIKMRLVALNESLLADVSYTATSTSLLEVRQFLAGRAEVERKLADQRRQLIALLDAVQTRNASKVPALLYPEPLLRLPMSAELPLPGTPSEARYVMYLAMDLWRDIPGSDRFLQAYFGTATPAYPT